MSGATKAADPGASGAASPVGQATGGLSDLIDLNRSLLSEFSSLQALLDNPPPEPDGGRTELRRRFAATLRELRRSRDELDRLGKGAVPTAGNPREVAP